MPIDRNDARALVDAGYMPLSEYIKLFGETDAAPDLVPAIEEKASPEKKLISSAALERSPLLRRSTSDVMRSLSR